LSPSSTTSPTPTPKHQHGVGHWRLLFFFSSKSCSMNRFVLSTYWRIESPSSTRFWTIPSIRPSIFAHSFIMVSISATILNSIGDKGSPCQRPFNVLQYHSMLSLTLIATLPLDTKINQSTALIKKPFILSVCWRKRPFNFIIGFLKILWWFSFCWSGVWL
jgi:hypothetical protein